MRLTGKLYAQHLGWTFKKHWQIQGRRVPRDTGATTELHKLGIQVKDVNDIVCPKQKEDRVEVVGFRSKIIPEDERHPNWHSKVCHIYSNCNVLLEGVSQAQVLTNTIELKTFPQNLEDLIDRMHFSNTVDRKIQNSIMAALVFDAQQMKLPKKKLENRPAYNLPREYGILHERKHRLLMNKLLFECEKLSEPSVTSQRRIVDSADFHTTVTKDDDLLKLSVRVEKLMTSPGGIKPIQSQFNGELPNLFPIKSTITIPKQNIYTMENFYPLSKDAITSEPHTIFLHFDKEQVKNLHGSNVTSSQFQSRSLMKAFAVAAARAQQLYGDSALLNLPRPIVVQSIHTDGCTFHFSVFQLNTLALSTSDNVKNYWFHKPSLDLFTECGYKAGKPYLSGYNKDVFRYFAGFYNNS